MQAILHTNLRIIQNLAKQYAVEKLWVFGSVCTDRFTEQSDIDFLVEFAALDYADYADQYFFFCEALEKIVRRPVDVVTVKSLSNPYFIRSIEKTKTLIYDRRNEKIFA